MGILCVFCVYDTIGNRCFEKTSFPNITVNVRLNQKPLFLKPYFHLMNTVTLQRFLFIF